MRSIVVLRAAVVCGALAAALLGGATAAHASQMIDRDATNVRLEVNAKGEALITYTSGGTLHHVLAWGAVNALPPSKTRPQVKFDLDYTGGWGKYFIENPSVQALKAAVAKLRGKPGYYDSPQFKQLHAATTYAKSYWRHFVNVCKPYRGPALAYVVAACTAPDGSNWALQSWDVPAPDLGFVPWTPALASTYLDLSHWTGSTATLEVYSDWVYREHYHRLFGKLTYDGEPVFGYSSTHDGAPTDSYGRLIYVDTLDAPSYGSGWRRENSFLTHSPSGTWCYGFYPKNPLTGGYSAPPGYDGGLRGPGIGSEYRISAIGPGVTPDVSTTIKDPGTFSAADPTAVAYEQAMHRTLLSLGPDPSCDAH